MSDNSRIYLSPPCVDHDEEEAVLDALRSGWVTTMGPALNDFENALSAQFGCQNVLALNSGTSALHLAVKLAGVKKGGKVLIGTFTFVAAANVVLYEGGEPVFIDSEDKTWNLDPVLLDERLKLSRNQNETISAVIVTHIYGIAAQIIRIQEVCKKYNVVLIEDAAEAVGTRVGGKAVGTFGDFGVLSFNGNKIITSGGGGALLCKNKRDLNKASFLASQAKDNAKHYQHSELGYNYALSNVLAGVGLSQLKKLEPFIEKKRKLKSYYKDQMSSFGVFDFLETNDESESNDWLTAILIRENIFPELSPSDLIEALENENIEARRFWKPLHLQPLYDQNEYFGLDVSEDKFNRGVCLPSGVSLSLKEQDKIIETIKSLLTSRGFLE